MAYHDRPFATLAFELSRAEANSFELLEQIPNAVDMDKVQLGPAGDVVVLSVHYQIAQKLHACTEVSAWDDWEQLWYALDVPDDARYSYADARQRFAQLI